MSRRLRAIPVWRLAPLLLLAAACSVGRSVSNLLVNPGTPAAVQAARRDIELTVFLIGDAGAPAQDEPVLAALARQAADAPSRRAIVYLGDNIYLRGLPDTNGIGRKESERRIDAQIAVARQTKTQTYFIPGNHDWAYMGPDGWNAIRRQESYIAAKGAPYAILLPSGGCPGPEAVNLSPNLQLVMIDTQWWLHDYERPVDSTSGCPYYTPGTVINALNRVLLRAGDRHSIVVGHHPLSSGGLHGGNIGWEPHIFPLRALAKWMWVPLPVVGSYYALNRQQGASDQDIAGPKNQRMRRALELVFERRKPLVYAAGHDHDLEVIKGKTARTLLVSGAGIFGHVSAVSARSNTLFAAAQSGFMRLDVTKDKRVRLGVITVDAEGRATEKYSAYLQ